ncbi:2-amino-4-hydroxy-6-hydroxymethyldihydropteridinediphosphokinase [soil metagenome]
MEHLVILSLGSNLGDRLSNLKKALLLIEKKIGKPHLISSIYETSPWGNTHQPFFLNLTGGFYTTLSPTEVLNNLMEIELHLGRVRAEKWAARIIDLDILYYEHEIIDEVNLRVPHPGIPIRRFILIPLCENYPNFIDPVSGKKQQELLAQCKDQEEVIKYNPVQ